MAVGNLVVSSKASPFPYAAVAIATYTQKAEVNYDPSATGLSFTSEGTKVTTEEDAVRTLAKAGGLAEDSVKVRVVNSWEIKHDAYMMLNVVGLDSRVLRSGQVSCQYHSSTSDYSVSRFSRRSPCLPNLSCRSRHYCGRLDNVGRPQRYVVLSSSSQLVLCSSISDRQFEACWSPEKQ
jgi:hypothetical protein